MIPLHFPIPRLAFSPAGPLFYSLFRGKLCLLYRWYIGELGAVVVVELVVWVKGKFLRSGYSS
jgi:hypothetical protein